MVSTTTGLVFSSGAMAHYFKLGNMPVSQYQDDSTLCLMFLAASAALLVAGLVGLKAANAAEDAPVKKISTGLYCTAAALFLVTSMMMFGNLPDSGSAKSASFAINIVSFFMAPISIVAAIHKSRTSINVSK